MPQWSEHVMGYKVLKQGLRRILKQSADGGEQNKKEERERQRQRQRQMERQRQRQREREREREREGGRERGRGREREGGRARGRDREREGGRESARASVGESGNLGERYFGDGWDEAIVVCSYEIHPATFDSLPFGDIQPPPPPPVSPSQRCSRARRVALLPTSLTWKWRR